jgi:hypothetical protein
MSMNSIRKTVLALRLEDNQQLRAQVGALQDQLKAKESLLQSASSELCLRNLQVNRLAEENGFLLARRRFTGAERAK